MLPAMLLIIPMFLSFSALGLFATLQGLVLASASWTVPFSVVLLRGFFLSIPSDIEQQALVDGCTRFGVLWRITLPLSTPGVVAVALFVFVWTWGDIIFPLILTNDVSNQTMAVILYNLMQSTRGAVNYGGLLAAGVLFALPTVILFTFLQRWVVQGTAAGALNG
jgi:N,N'-diacetylchitobiose transport system permease protein